MAAHPKEGPVQAMRTVRGLVYSRFGSPLEEVAFVKDHPLEATHGLLCKFLASPINPSDINQISGRYPVKPAVLPAFAGNEGVAEVVEVGGDACGGFAVGDRVIPRRSCLGTWRSHAVLQASDVVRIPRDIPIDMASSLLVNIPTAFRLLRDFGSHRRVVQNAATSVVGQLVVQLCALWNIETLSIIRHRDTAHQTDQVKKALYGLGATLVFTEQELQLPENKQAAGHFAPTLALNGVGGSNATEMLDLLADSVCVTYGAMANRPFSVPASVLIYKNIRIAGYWMTRWYQDHSEDERQDMLDEIYGLIRAKSIKITTHEHSLEDYRQALQQATQASPDAGSLLRRKHLFVTK